MVKNINDPIEQFHKDIKMWIKSNNWKHGKCDMCGKELYPIIDFKNICAICMNMKIKETVKKC